MLPFLLCFPLLLWCVFLSLSCLCLWLRWAELRGVPTLSSELLQLIISSSFLLLNTWPCSAVLARLSVISSEFSYHPLHNSVSSACSATCLLHLFVPAQAINAVSTGITVTPDSSEVCPLIQPPSKLHHTYVFIHSVSSSIKIQ